MKLNYMYEMNTRQIQELARKTDIAFLPVGPTEVHSQHLPVGTNIESAIDVCERAARKLAERGVETLIAPPVNYALADAVNCFVGNITLRYETVVAVVEDCDENGLATASLRNKFAAGDEIELVGPDVKPVAFQAPMMEDGEGFPLREPRHPQMTFKIQLPCYAPRLSFLRACRENS